MLKKSFNKYYLASCVINSPLFAIYILLPFILFKDLKATPLQIMVLMSIKPVVAILSTYWNTLKYKPKQSLIWAMMIGTIPTILFPFYTNTWLFILAFGCYFFAERAVIPIWVEGLEQHLNKVQLSKSIGRGSLINFIASSVVPVIVSFYLDVSSSVWKEIFALLALISLLRIPIASFLVMPSRSQDQDTDFGLWSRPWKKCYRLLKRRPDFALYQMIFLFGGLGIMVTQPVLPQFVDSVLGLSYTELAIAIALCKGAGFVLTNPFWSTWIHRVDIYFFSAIVSLMAALSLSLVLFSSSFSPAIYLAFLCYGVMQAGSQLSWQLGGPIFSNAENSNTYTMTSIMLVGLRGCVGPYIGGVACALQNPQTSYFIGITLCFTGGLIGLIAHRMRTTDRKLVRS